jgi:hypothetical protein
VTEEAALSQLREAYRGTGFEVRFYPDCCTIMRWQVGRNGDGQHFAVIAYGSTPGRLLECLEARASSKWHGMTKTEISIEVFNRHASSAEIDEALRLYTGYTW